MPNKKFLEETPLYTKKEVDLIKIQWGTYDFKFKIPYPSINYMCPTCKSIQTYNFLDDDDKYNKDEIIGITFFITYTCAGCGQHTIEYFINFSEEEIKNKKGKTEVKIYAKKVGQNPSWSVRINKRLDEMLGKYSDYYKNGLICESQSYGIGAYAYFRRITEEIIDELLNSIFDLIDEEENKEKYKKALEEVKKTKDTKRKIELVKDLLPSSLKIDSVNPLGVLHSALSAGLHGKSDEDCMKQAEIIRKVLVYLVNQIIKNKKDKKNLSERLRKLLS